MPTSPRKPLLVNLAWAAALVLLLAVGYVLSYPIALRLVWSIDIPAYRPVQYLIDRTPFSTPIIWWSRLCGTAEEVVNFSIYRASLRDLSDSE
jgi:hypothetical protein